jgi:hypothetical protein
MPVIGSDSEILKEYLGTNDQGRIYLGSQKIQDGPNPYLVVRGGTITTDGDYKIHTFSTVGTSSLFIDELAQIPANNEIEYLVVAGGGAGGCQPNGAAPGGGAGGLLSGSYTPLSIGSNSIIIGAGGLGTTTFDCPDSGSNSSAFGFLAYGGGSGRDGNTCTGDKNGGSGAGGGITLDAAQGNNGGTSLTPGGGGAGQVGQDGGGSCPGFKQPGLFAGNGGSGSLSSITGTPTYYAGGGGGGGTEGDFCDRAPGTGGVGGGGIGGDFGGTGAQRSGKDATFYGGGGGGAGDTRSNTSTTFSGDGYQGIVIIRYKYQN